MFLNQGTSQPEASQFENGDMAKEWEELVELDDVQLATVVGGGLLDVTVGTVGGGLGWVCWGRNSFSGREKKDLILLGGWKEYVGGIWKKYE